jgi:UDP-N-acetylglucosamine 2-epimerase
MFTDKLSEYIYEIELTKKLFAKYSFSSVLIVSEVSPNSQIIINLAKKFGVKIALIQHGMYADAFPETFQYNKSGVLPNLSDKFLVWGEVLKKYSIDCGISSDKIQIIGNPAYDDFFKQSKEGLSDNSYILLTTTFTQHDIVYDLTMNSRLQRKKIIEHICHTVTKLKRKLVIKLHPTFDDDNITDFVHKINPEIIIIKSGDVLDLIKNCEFLITLDMSTTILEAQILNKPALSMFVTDRKFGISEVFKSASCISVTNDLEKILIKLINNDQFKNDLISNGKKFSQKYLSHQGTSSKNLISFLEDF